MRKEAITIIRFPYGKKVFETAKSLKKFTNGNVINISYFPLVRFNNPYLLVFQKSSYRFKILFKSSFNFFISWVFIRVGHFAPVVKEPVPLKLNKFRTNFIKKPASRCG